MSDKPMMILPLRILIIEDSEADAELLLLELRRGGYAPEGSPLGGPRPVECSDEMLWWRGSVGDSSGCNPPRIKG